MNRICRNESIGAVERNLDYDEIVDMFEVITNDLLSMLGATIVNDKVSCSTNAYLVGDMTR